MKQNKHVIITGTSRGIGYEMALYLANEGCQVLAISRKTPQALIEHQNISTLLQPQEPHHENPPICHRHPLRLPPRPHSRALELLAAYAISFLLGVATACGLRTYTDAQRKPPDP